MNKIFKDLTFYKYFSVFCFFGLFIVSMTNVINYYHLNQMSQSALRDQIDFQFSRVESSTQSLVGTTEQVVSSLAASPFLSEYINAKSEVTQAQLEAHMLGLAKANPSIFQLRFLDVNGNEIIDVYQPNTENNYRIEPPEQLQSKSDRNYMREMLRTPDGEFYYSAINLNKEFGVLERPIRPTLRVATPVPVGENARRAGYVIANMDARYLLSIWVSNDNLDLYILDKDGFFIASSDSELNFNRFINKSTEIQRRAERVSSELLSPSQEIYTFTLTDLIPNDAQLTLYARASTGYVEALHKEAATSALQSIALLLLASLPIAVLFSSSLTKIAMKLRSNIKEKERFATIIDRHIPIIETTKEGMIKDCNKAMINLSGYKRRELLGASVSILQHKDAKPEDFHDLWDTLNSGSDWKGEFQNQTAQGDDFWLYTHITHNKDEQGNTISYLAISNDITDSKRLARRAEFDAMTGLYNRLKGNHILEHHIELAMKKNTPFGVILFDIDNFKRINDTYGQEEGDMMLKEVGSLLSYHARRTDTVVRWEGESFLVICPNVTSPQCSQLAETIRAAVESHSFNGEGKSITISAGVATFTYPATSSEILSIADFRLYEAKRKGRNCVVSELNKYSPNVSAPSK